MFSKLLFVTEIGDREKIHNVYFKNQSSFTVALSYKTPGA